MLQIKEAANFGGDNSENLGNEGKASPLLGMFAYWWEDEVYVMEIGCLKDFANASEVFFIV